jgi:2-amino-4-hydroxy-6-hydroxymethyldihydropteridine diphosphokinase
MLYTSKPMYVEDQPQFLNGVLKIDTKLPPLELLSALKRVEASVGRVVTYR